MKHLTLQEFNNAPSEVQFIYTMCIMKVAIGSQILEDAIKEYPKYFPDEVEHRRKWALIPEGVHEEYLAERSKLREECYKDMPPSKGIIGWIQDGSGYKEWSEAYDICRKKEKPLAKELHKKYYEKYGIEFSGW